MVSVFAFYSDDPSSNPAEANSFSVKFVFEKNPLKTISTRYKPKVWAITRTRTTRVITRSFGRWPQTKIALWKRLCKRSFKLRHQIRLSLSFWNICILGFVCIERKSSSNAEIEVNKTKIWKGQKEGREKEADIFYSIHLFWQRGFYVHFLFKIRAIYSIFRWLLVLANWSTIFTIN